jgi:hypothetical protein
MIATPIDTAVTPTGIVQFPFVPHTVVMYVSSGPSGVARGPMLSSPARVSNRRHGVVGTKDDAFGDPAADAVNKVPPPKIVATTAPTANQRERLDTADPHSSRTRRSTTTRSAPGGHEEETLVRNSLGAPTLDGEEVAGVLFLESTTKVARSTPTRNFGCRNSSRPPLLARLGGLDGYETRTGCLATPTNDAMERPANASATKGACAVAPRSTT